LNRAKEALLENLEWPLRHPDLFREANTSPSRGILLSGSPGTGKTLLARAVASQSGANFISVKGPALLSRWVGDSEKGIREIFRKARQASPCIIFFDEIDAIAPIRGQGADSQVTERVITQLLTEIDGIEELRGVTVLAASNRPDMIDPALLRPGRFDYTIELPTPDEDARRDIFRIHTKGKPLAEDVDLEAISRETIDFVGSEIEAVCRRASMLAIGEYLKANSWDPNEDRDSADLKDPGNTENPGDLLPERESRIQITAGHFQQAFQEMKTRKGKL
jgi:transitional endoplasmic reticulum ATPase